MIYKIHDQDANTLLEKPETGMGYQIVIAKQYNKFQERIFVVYNTNLAVELDSDFLDNKRRVLDEGYKTILNKVTELMLETNSINIVEQSKIRESKSLSNLKKIYNKRQSGGRGATDNPKENANGDEIFVRLSAFEDDRRIDLENMKLKPGSFTTTGTDYLECVTTNDDPIDRYALPNDDKIKWSFYIKPKTNDTLQRGIVQPAFEHEGGGIEAYFEDGTSKGTFLFKREYGK